jgi:Salmonella virulence plasmid 65kDa B protein
MAPTTTANPSTRGAQNSDDDKAPSISAPISLPKGGGAIRGIGEKFDVDLATGTGTMNIPIPTTPCRDAHPVLSLSYNSGNGNSIFGLGWDITQHQITCKTDKGIPQYNDDIDIFLLLGEDLTAMNLDEQGNVAIPDERRGDFLIRKYAPRIKGEFNLIERWTQINGPNDVYWRTITPNNTTSIYGRDESSRIQDPSGKRIFSWLVCETYDSRGNAILYEYKKEDSAGVNKRAMHEMNRTERVNLYLKRIKYGNRTSWRDQNTWLPSPTPIPVSWMFSVVFDYGEHDMNHPTETDGNSSWLCRKDPFSTYRPGFEVRTYRLCQRILMFHHLPNELGMSDCLVSSMDLTYDDNPFATYLTSITRVGYLYKDGQYLKKALPPLEFSYSAFPTDSELSKIRVQQVGPESLQNLPQGVDGTYQWLDFHEEGIPGVFVEQGGGWYYKRNRGTHLV